ncbi:MAG: curli-like amyloid fiber formation chaperone CsgH [Roseovarius sp.]
MKRKIPTAALVILAAGSATAFGAFVGQGEAHETARASAEGLRCAVVTRDLGDAVQITGKVTAERDVSGQYELSIRQTSGGGQAVIDQGGDFTVGAGRTVTLGEATMGGTAQSYTAELDLTVNGQRLRCRPATDTKDL